MGFAILTDTSCNLPQSLVDEYGLELIPLRYTLDGCEHTSFTDGKQADFGAFYDAMRSGKVVTTSLADARAASEIATRLVEGGTDVLYLGFSSGLSGSYAACEAALSEVAAAHPERKVLCADTLAASAGQGLLITYVARMRARGASVDECHEWVLKNRLSICHWFTVDDLMFLKRGGRVSAVSAVFGTALNIKPVMHVDTEGRLKVVDKVRGRKKAIAALADHFGEALVTCPASEQIVYISHGDCEGDARALADLLVKRYSTPEEPLAYPLITYVDPVIGAHSGPGTLALFFFDADVSHR